MVGIYLCVVLTCDFLSFMLCMFLCEVCYTYLFMYLLWLWINVIFHSLYKPQNQRAVVPTGTQCGSVTSHFCECSQDLSRCFPATQISWWISNVMSQTILKNSRGQALNPRFSLERPRGKRLDHCGIDSFTFIYTLLEWAFRRAS